MQTTYYCGFLSSRSTTIRFTFVVIRGQLSAAKSKFDEAFVFRLNRENTQAPQQGYVRDGHVAFQNSRERRMHASLGNTHGTYQREMPGDGVGVSQEAWHVGHAFKIWSGTCWLRLRPAKTCVALPRNKGVRQARWRSRSATTGAHHSSWGEVDHVHRRPLRASCRHKKAQRV